MSDELTDLLATALDAYLLDRRVAVNHEAVLAAIPPDKADAMRAGLLLGEMQAEYPASQFGVAWKGAYKSWTAYCYPPAKPVVQTVGPTLLAALTDLREKLR